MANHRKSAIKLEATSALPLSDAARLEVSSAAQVDFGAFAPGEEMRCTGPQVDEAAGVADDWWINTGAQSYLDALATVAFGQGDNTTDDHKWKLLKQLLKRREAEAK